MERINSCRLNVSDITRRNQCLVIALGVVLSYALARGAPLSAKSISAAQVEQQPAALELGKPVERELAGGEKHIYQIALTDGQYAAAIVEQRGIDVVVRWLGPDGKQIADFDGETRPQGEEKTEVVSETAGSYRVIVEAKQRAAAGRYAIRLVDLRAATERDRALQEARQAYAESLALRRAGKYDEALKVGARALEIRERWLGHEHSELAAPLNNLAFVYRDKADFVKAEQLFQRSLEIREKTLGPDHPNVAASLNNLAILYKDRAEFNKAEQLYQRAQEILERALTPQHPSVAFALGNLAEVARLKGDYLKAEQLNQRALQILEKTLGPEHTEVAVSLNNLGNVYKEKGDFAGAEPLYERARGILEKSLGPYHPNVAAVLGNLSEVSRQKGDYSKAESLSQRVLEICEKALGPAHPNVAFALGDLALLYRSKGDFAKAEQFHQRALEILEKALGPEHPDVAASLNNLAILYLYKGDFAKAEELCQRALEIREKALGPEQPAAGESMDTLATIHAAKGDFARAIADQSRAAAITERNVSLNLVTGSERQKLAYLTSLSETTDRTLSLHLRDAPDDARARGLAAITILQRKGRVLDAMSDSLTSLRRRLTTEDQTLLDELRDTTSQLATLVLNGPQRTTLNEHQKRIKLLEEQRERLESQISLRSAGFYERAAPVTLATVQAAIPVNAALIEFSTYRPFDPKAVEDKAYGDPRYVAYILRREGAVQWKELGEAKEIDAVVARLRQALRDPKRSDVQRIARIVDAKVMQPLRVLTGDATQLLVSPDGELNLIPFEALVDEQARYLIERYSFSYLTSGRDLLRSQVTRASKSDSVVLANPLFGEPELVAAAKIDGAKTRRSLLDRKRQSVLSGSDLSDVYFAPLEGTAEEARSIRSLFGDASVLTGTQASESSLKKLIAPRILHIATHGFFLSDAPPSSSSSAEKTRAINASVKIENPLLRSGLALAGANLHRDSGEDGILTALEASGLNLWGTKLVTLSACDTGVGEVRNGEGVYGLRRAFVLAGTETLVMSLWPISDYVTREIMTAYYRGLKQGEGRGEALRQVQLKMLKRKGREHPFYWASFIQSGEWANLDGKR